MHFVLFTPYLCYIKLIENRIDTQTLAEWMGISVAVIEWHHSKLTATMAAERFA